jgi:PKD repeat protein
VVRRRARATLAVVFGIPYGAFLLWCFFLLSVLPSASGQFDPLIPVGIATSAGGAIVLVFVAVLATRRILRRRELSAGVRMQSGLRVLAITIPGIALSAMVTPIIIGEPRLPLRIIEPAGATVLEAPLPVTFSLEEAVAILQRRGGDPIRYRWDFTADGVIDNVSVEPQATAVYERAEVYTVAAIIELSDGTTRRVTTRLPIQREVFSVKPFVPLVDEPVLFSVAHLVGVIQDEDGDTRSDLREVRWDFNGDGVPDETTTGPEVAHTFIRTGPVLVSATIQRETQGQQQYQKEIIISEHPPLPFPVSVISQPATLVGPAPFPAQFRVETDEPIRSVQWDFGDGDDAEGMSAGHTFQRVGDYIVTAEVRAETGDIARLTEQVRVTGLLQLRDLTISGTHEVDPRNAVIRGEVPLTVGLTARTGQQLIAFSWEAPDATVQSIADRTLNATYRRPGRFTITLFAQDPDGLAVRLPIEVDVQPPSAHVVLRMNPTRGRAPLTVTFDASETNIPGEEITGFEWLFGDEIGQDPAPEYAAGIIQHTYERPGEYSVVVRALTTQSQQYEERATIVVSQPLLKACFQPSRTELAAPGGVAFDLSCTTGTMDRVEWDFGDGAKSEQRGPLHEYLTPGEYPVRLTVWQGETQDTFVLTITVR